MKIKMYCGVSFVNVEHDCEEEIPDEELEGMSEEEKREYILSEYVEPWANSYLNFRYEAE